MANENNLKGWGFENRTESERRELAKKAGKASGEARRKKADFRKTLNLLLTTEIDNPEWTPALKALGLDSTLESVINAVIIKKALMGDVKAYNAIRDTLGQTTKSELDIKEQETRGEVLKAQADKLKSDTANGKNEETNNPFSGLTTEQLLKLVGEDNG